MVHDLVDTFLLLLRMGQENSPPSCSDALCRNAWWDDLRPVLAWSDEATCRLSAIFGPSQKCQLNYALQMNHDSNFALFFP